jgi:serine/threonine protein kinase
MPEQCSETKFRKSKKMKRFLTGVSVCVSWWCEQKEAMVMRRCAHENIIQLHTSFTYQQDLWMVMDYMNRGEYMH